MIVGSKTLIQGEKFVLKVSDCINYIQKIEEAYLAGKTYREISTEVGVPENSIGPTLTRAREKLKQLRVGVE